jgi:hypothetical protein
MHLAHIAWIFFIFFIFNYNQPNWPKYFSSLATNWLFSLQRKIWGWSNKTITEYKSHSQLHEYNNQQCNRYILATDNIPANKSISSRIHVTYTKNILATKLHESTNHGATKLLKSINHGATKLHKSTQQPAATFQQTKLHCYTHQNSTAQPAQAMITSMKHTLNIHDRFNMKQKLESK